MRRALILSPAGTSTCMLLEAQAAAAGLAVLRLPAPSMLPAALTEDPEVAVYVYGGPRWASAFAAALDLALLEPLDTWLPGVPRRFTQRSIKLMEAGAIAGLDSPFFAKPPREKTFEGAVYTSTSFAEMARDAALATAEPVLVAEQVEFGREYRLLVLDGRIHTGSRYLSWGVLDPLPVEQDPHAAEVLAFGALLLDDQAVALPAAFTLDVGYARNTATGEEGWAVVEANMAWFSNIYACDAGKALDVVLRAAGPARLCSPAELAFTRPQQAS